MRRAPLPLRACLTLLRVFALLVPSGSRRDWRAEWEAEVHHRWSTIEGGQRFDWSDRMDLFRRSLGALPDAAWLRRQFTADADIVHDLRHGVRVLWKSPSFTIAAVFILALGIGGTVSIVTLLDTLFFRPLPYADADRVVTIWTRSATTPGQREDVSPAGFLDLRERSRSFAAIAAVIPYSYDYTGGGEPEALFGAQVTEGFWDAIGMRPRIGRAFVPEEHTPGGRRSVIITHGLWQRRFGGDPDVLNRTISLDGTLFTIVGVLPPEFAPQLLPRPGELSVWGPKIIQEHEKQIRGSAWWNVVARLRPGVTPEEAQRELDSISAAIAQQYPSSEGKSAWVIPMRDHLMGDVRVPLFVMLGAVVLVLGIGCANVASLLLARGMEREREFAIRTAIGAGRFRLIRQLVAESLLLSVTAAAVGVALAYWTLGAILALAPSAVLRLHDAVIDARILLFAGALTTLTAVAFGLIPAFQFSGRAREVITERQSSGPRATLRRGLVAAEIACALVLLVAAGLLIRSFDRLMAVDPGFSPKNVVAVQVFAWDRTGTGDKVRNFFDTTLARLRTIPGVDAAGAVSAMPFAISNIDIKTTLDVIGKPALSERERRGAYLTIATPGYFTTMSIPLREGRFLEERDTNESPGVAVISRDLATREWPNESPVGRRIRVRWQGEPLELEVVGVVSQVRHERLDRAARPEIFVPLAQVPFASMTYVLRGRGEPRALIDAAKREIWAVDPLLPAYDAAPLEAMVGASAIRERFSMTVMSVFALVALLLCASGVYGIISFTTAQRTREIGVRMALGADGPAIQRMVLREGSAVIAVGIGLGLVGAVAAGRYLRTLLFEVKPGDPATMLAVCAVLAIVGLAACYGPARRATRVDPLIALRNDP
jgi:putative ABC transport system permease protein